ncbi:MAG: TlpA disulfide reductase family protein [Solirubrobacterales bacterium]
MSHDMNNRARTTASSVDRAPRTFPALVSLLVLLAAGPLAACGTTESTASPAPDYEATVAKAPPKLAELYSDGDALLGGGGDTYAGKIDAVRGYPVVVNNWASWCLECREEFPYFQSQAAQHLDQVAFLGVDSEDSTDAAETYLSDNPLPYPSVEAPGKDFQDWTDTTLVGYPNTLFYDAGGELVYVKQGVYASEDDLAADIAKYALTS